MFLKKFGITLFIFSKVNPCLLMQVTNGLIFVENDSGLILVLAILKNLAPFTLFHSSNILIIEKEMSLFLLKRLA